MSFYQINLGAFVAGNAFLLYRQWKASKAAPQQKEDVEGATPMLNPGNMDAEVNKFKRDFFVVYALAVAADWLQGPHIYAIYKYEKNIEEKLVAMLYAAGFISGAISASFAGQLADKYGRRFACLIYCLMYTLTCMTMLSNNFTVLFIGRFCGGISTTLLFSVFEAWMITEYHNRGLQNSGLQLGSVFGFMTTLSCIVAIVSGVVGDVLVAELGGRVWPFMASIVCCGFAAYFMVTTWRENFGAKQAESSTSLGEIRDGIKLILADKKILSLGITSCFFEGSMYLMIFFWSAALKSARARSGSNEELPFGLIFSSFMCAMMGGSAYFSIAHSPSQGRDSAAHILMGVVLLVSACLSAAVVIENEYLLFYALCAFEACIGSYFPSIGFLKSEVVEDGVRGRVYSILRMPLNVFVVVAHSLDKEGDGHRNNVFLTCAGFLMLSFFVVKRAFAEQSSS